MDGLWVAMQHMVWHQGQLIACLSVYAECLRKQSENNDIIQGEMGVDLKVFSEQSPSETTVYFQPVNYNDAISANQRSIYMKSKQARTERRVDGEGEGERKREREQRINGMREGVLDRNGNGVSQKWPLEKLSA
jgi:hypothetical protein